MKTNYQNTGMLDMIFENRNKTYGAYALRSDYNQRISRALIITTSMVFVLCFGKLLSDKFKSNATQLVDITTIATLSDPIILDKPAIKIEPPVQKPPVAKGVSTIANPEMKVTADNHFQDSVPTHEQLQDLESGLTTNITDNSIGVTDGHGTEETFNKEPAAPPVIEKVFTYVEKMPEFPGGESALMDFVRNNTVYPNREHDLDIEGKALLKFVVNEDGSIANIAVMKTDSRGFGEEGKRVVALMPKFKPGMQAGKPVKVQFVLPFQFKMR